MELQQDQFVGDFESVEIYHKGERIYTEFDDGVKREFATGATRDTSENKNEYSGFLSPLVIEMFGNYMTKHRIQSDGSVRSASNWKKGMPLDVYIESMFRHFLDLWKEHEGYKSRDGIEDALCGLYFNIQGYMHEYIKAKMRRRQ